ncbi:MAG: SAVED domain-containing protein [Candidatus Thiodiazotropha endolucinida]
MDRGIQTWRDNDNLEFLPTEDELIRVIEDPDTVGAVVLVVPETVDSDMIRNVEAPRIFKRARETDFIVLPILIGMNYEDADSILNRPAGFQELKHWNLKKIKDKHLTDTDAREIANTYLKSVIRKISTSTTNQELTLTVNTRSIHGQCISGLNFNFCSYFDGRDAKPGAYESIEVAFKDVASIIAANYECLKINSSGFASLPIGVLFGAIFSPLRRFYLTWSQSFAGNKEEQWGFVVDPSSFAMNIKSAKGDTSSEEVVLGIGISANIEPAVTDYVKEIGLKPRAYVYLEPSNGPLKQGQALSPSEGVSVVLQVIDAIRDIKDNCMLQRVNLHLFMACPLAMAVLIGQKLNTVSRCSIYEHTPTTEQIYTHVHTFRPSDMTYTAV